MIRTTETGEMEDGKMIEMVEIEGIRYLILKRHNPGPQLKEMLYLKRQAGSVVYVSHHQDGFYTRPISLGRFNITAKDIV